MVGISLDFRTNYQMNSENLADTASDVFNDKCSLQQKYKFNLHIW